MRRIGIIRWGRFAARFAASHPHGRVAAVFERCVHVTAGTEIICIGDASIGNGPLNAVIDPADAAILSRRSVRPGDRIGFDIANAQTRCELIFTTAHARLWRPPVVPPRNKPPQIEAAMATIERLARAHASSDGLARLVLCLDAPDTPLHRIAAPRLAALRCWLVHLRSPSCRRRASFASTRGEGGGTRRAPRLDHTPTPDPSPQGGGESTLSQDHAASTSPPTSLLGLGPGLTPSGDDLLCGCLIALHTLERTAHVAALGDAIRAEAHAATSRASAAMLAAAAEGEAGEALHLAVNALIGGPRESQADVVTAAGRVGHTSGWDALAGVALVLASAAVRSA